MFFEDIEFGWKNKVRDFVLEEESVTIPKLIHPVAFDKKYGIVIRWEN